MPKNFGDFFLPVEIVSQLLSMVFKASYKPIITGFVFFFFLACNVFLITSTLLADTNPALVFLVLSPLPYLRS